MSESVAPSNPKRHLWRWFGLSLFALLLLVLAILAWALGTNAGARTLANQLLPDNIQIAQLSGRLLGPLHLRQVQVETASASVWLDEVSLDWQPQNLFAKTLKITQLKLKGVKVELLPTASDPNPQPTTLPEKIATPVAVILDELLLIDVQILQAEATISLDRVRLQASWLDSLLQVQGLEVQAGEGIVALQGQAQLEGDYPIDVSAAVKALQLQQVQASLPLVRLDATASAQGPVLDPQALIELTALLADQPEPIQLRVEGGAQAYEFTGHTRWQQANNTLPIQIVGSGDLEAVQIQQLQIGVEQAPAMQLTAHGNLGWVSGLNGAFTLNGDGINPAVFATDLAADGGRIPEGELQVGAQVELRTTADDKLSVDLDALQVDGRLGTLPLSVLGQLKWSQQQLSITQLTGNLGSQQVQWQVSGEIAQQNNLRWSFAASGLEEVSQALGLAPQDQVQGQIEGEGYVRGTQANPSFSAVVDARDLVYQAQRLDSLKLSLEGTARAHELAVVLDSPDLQSSFGLSGELQVGGRWQFSAHRWQLDARVAQQTQSWVLQQPAQGWFEQGQFELLPACLAQVQPSSAAAVCLQASNPADRVLAEVELRTLDLQMLNPWLPPDVQLRGVLEGVAGWGGELTLSRGELQLDGLAIAVKSESGWLDAVAFDPSRINLTPQADKLTLVVDLPIGSDGVRLESEIANSTLATQSLPPADWPVTGKLQIQLPKLAWLGAFSPEVELTDTSLAAQIDVSGTLGEPSLLGNAQLQIASALLTTPDITLEQTQVQLTGSNKGIGLQGTATTDGEVVQLAADVTWQDALSVKGSLQGNNLLISDSATALVRVSPDLSFAFKDNLLKVRGKVVLPQVDVRLRQAPSGAIAVSQDQILVDTENATEEQLPVAVDARVNIVLGDEVRFAGLGLAAEFSGELEVQQQPDSLARGTGEIRITQGSYTAYGQDLTIERGRVLFAGGPLTQPGLDVRAVRQATPEVAVGVNVRGSLAEPKLTLFSDPSLPESDQLSYLVLGRPMSGGSASERSVLQQAALALGVKGGKLITERLSKSLAVDNIGIESAPGTSNDQAALVIGKYLSPKLYVSYGYGLFEPISTLRLEYQLSRLWRIVTESTNQAAGGDFEWVLEK